jgi:hypothetical protein
MSREIGSDQTTKQRLVHTAPSQLPLPLHCMPVHQSMHACWWRGFQVQDRYRLCCWSVGGVLGALGRDPCSRCRDAARTKALILLFSDVTRHSWPHRATWRCMMRVAAAGCKRPQGTVPSMIHARAAWVGGTAAMRACFDSCRDRVQSEGAVSAFLASVVSVSVRPSGARPACATTATQTEHRHMDTALCRQAREAQGWLDRQTAIVVSACV